LDVDDDRTLELVTLRRPALSGTLGLVTHGGRAAINRVIEANVGAGAHELEGTDVVVEQRAA
jgi:hypothetical protein